MFLLSALIFLLTAFFLGFLGRVWPEFGYHWPVAAVGGLFAWLTGLLSPLLVQLPEGWLVWPAELMLEPVLVFGWDPLSWAFAAAIGALALAVTLTDIWRAPSADWTGWAACQLIAGLGILAAFAGNFFTFLVIFTGLDVSLILFIIRRPSEDSIRPPQVVGRFALRQLGTGLLIYSLLIEHAFSTGTGTVGAGWLQIVLFIAGFSFRLVNIGPTSAKERDSIAVGLDLIPAAATLILIPRWFGAVVPVLPPITVFGIAAVLIGVIQALTWAVSENARQGRQAWLAAAGALVLLAALRGQPQASGSWGIVLLLSGGVFALYQPAQRWLVAAPVIALWAYSGLPLSPAWEGMDLYSSPLSLVFAFGLLIHGLLLVGNFRHSGPGRDIEVVNERWVRLISPIGLAVLLITQQWVTWVPAGAPLELSRHPWWPGVSAILIGTITWWWLRQGDVAGTIRDALKAIGGFLVVSARPLIGIPRFIARVTAFLTTILEGEGGVLWALLLLTLLLSILVQLNLNGLGYGN